MNQFPPSSRVFNLDRFKFFSKIHGHIRKSRCTIGINDTVANLPPPVSTKPAAKLPPVSTTPVANLPPVSATPVANFSTIFACIVDTGGKFAAGVNDTGGKFANGVNDAVANCHRYQRRRRQICLRCCWHRWQIMATISGCRHKWTWRQKFIHMLTLLPKGVQTKFLQFFSLKVFSFCHRCCWHRWQPLSW